MHRNHAYAWFRAVCLGFSVTFDHKKHLARHWLWTVTFFSLLRLCLSLNYFSCLFSCFFSCCFCISFCVIWWFVRNDCSVVCLVDEIFDLVRLQCIYQCYNTFVVFISFFYCDDIYIGLSCFWIRCFVCDCIICYGKSCFYCIITIDNCECYFTKYSRYLCCFQFLNLDIFCGRFDIIYGSCQARTFF